MTSEVKLEPTAEEIELARVIYCALEGEHINPETNRAHLDAIFGPDSDISMEAELRAARAAILAMDRRASPPAEPVCWRWQFGDSPWSYGSEKPSFQRRVGSEGMDPDNVEPLYASDPADKARIAELERVIQEDGVHMAELMTKYEALLAYPPAPAVAVPSEGDIGSEETYLLHLLRDDRLTCEDLSRAMNRIRMKRIEASMPTVASITDGMVNAAWNKGKDLRMTGLPSDFRAVLDAAFALVEPAPAVAVKLTKGQKLVLEWLAKDDGSLGECHGDDLTTLVSLGFAEIGPKPAGMHEHYSRVSITDAGRSALVEPAPAVAVLGWVTLPAKMTAAMINAWSGGETVSSDTNAYRTTFQDAWARVLAAAPQPPATRSYEEPVTLTYTNWRGETAERSIVPRGVWYGSTEWHPEPQWLLRAFDVKKQADRDFALKDFGKRAPSIDVQIERLKEAIEGECDGLAIDDASAKIILAYVDTGDVPDDLVRSLKGGDQ